MAGFSFLSCFVQDRNVARVVAQVDELKDGGSTASRLMKWTRPDNRWYSFRLEWHATRLCVLERPELQVLAVGPGGIVSVGTAGGNVEEEIDATDDGPRRRGDIRDLRIVGEHVYAAGMSRQVYRRERPGLWSRQDTGVVQARGSLDIAGFNALDGVDEDDLHAVGFGGEIWHYTQGVWHQASDVTNLVLHRVRVISADMAYVSGQQGLILRGYGDRWSVVPQDLIEDDIWGIEWFRGALYMATDAGLFILGEGDEVRAVDMGLDHPVTCRHLHTSDGMLVSSGPKHVTWTEDGVTWHDITP